MIVVSDTSPLNYLVLIGEIDILPPLFGRVLAPPEVLRELQHPQAPAPVRDWAKRPPPWLELRAPTMKSALGNLGAGESDAISLAQELRADLILIDERPGTRAVEKLGLQPIGTLGVIRMASQRHLLSFRDAILELRKTNFRGPDELIDEFLKSDEDTTTS
jgi:predicted nucleic acid-binding protein